MAGIGLTPAQTQAVKETWGILEENLKEHGVAIFVVIYSEYPELKQMFRRIKNVPQEELEQSAGVRAHAVGFMKEVSGMIDCLENTDELIVMVENNARRHHRRKVTVQQYEAVLGLFGGYLKDTLKERFSEDAAIGWQCVTKAITTTIEKEYQAIEAENQ